MTLSAWLSAGGGRLAACVQILSRDGTRGVHAQSCMGPGESVVSVPSRLMLTAGRSSVASALDDMFGLEEADRLIIALLYERSLGNKSHMWPWINELPSANELSEGMPIFWVLQDGNDDEVRSALCCTKTAQRVRSQYAEVRARYENLVEIATRSCNDRAIASSGPIGSDEVVTTHRGGCSGASRDIADAAAIASLLKHTTFGDYLWAWAILESRAIYLHSEALGAERLVLVPVNPNDASNLVCICAFVQ